MKFQYTYHNHSVTLFSLNCNQLILTMTHIWSIMCQTWHFQGKTGKNSPLASALLEELSPSLQLTAKLPQEKDSSSSLSSLLLNEFGFSLHKGGFRDALSLRYGWQPPNIPSNCECGTSFSVEHYLSCPLGCCTIIRYNKVKDIFGEWMRKVCNGVEIEPSLQPLSGENLSGATSNSDDGTRLVITAKRLWGGWYERSFLMFSYLIHMLHPTDSTVL